MAMRTCDRGEPKLDKFNILRFHFFFLSRSHVDYRAARKIIRSGTCTQSLSELSGCSSPARSR